MPPVLRRRSSRSLHRFDRPFLERFRFLAGIDEAGRGPLAGPVVAAAVILPATQYIPRLQDSKLLSPTQRCEVYRFIQRHALAMGVGIVHVEEIDRINILQATYVAMRLALTQLIVQPLHVLVDGRPVPIPLPHTAIVDGDRQSACIAAASIVAKVTRDAVMERMDRHYPGYNFRQHKGYGTPEHLKAIRELGPCDIHRRSFAPIRMSTRLEEEMLSTELEDSFYD